MSEDSLNNPQSPEDDGGKKQDEKIEDAFEESLLTPLTGEMAAEYERFCQQFPDFDRDLANRIEQAMWKKKPDLN